MDTRYVMKGQTSATGVGLDIGGIYVISDVITAGIMVQDIGSYLDWKTGHKDQLPVNVRFGANYKILGGKLILSIDNEYISRRGENKVHIGTEYNVVERLSLRLGLNEKYFSGGMGMKYAISKKVLMKMDYAFSADKFTESEEGYNHRISLVASF